MSLREGELNYHKGNMLVPYAGSPALNKYRQKIRDKQEKRRRLLGNIDFEKQKILLPPKPPKEVQEIKNPLITAWPASLCRIPAVHRSTLVEICRKFNADIYEVGTVIRNVPCFKARIEFVKIMREDHNVSFPQLGSWLNRDHTTIMYYYNKARGIERIRKKIEDDTN